ncbi:HET-domain-containing protein, partial [Lizonia empirigonia]
PEVVGLRVIDCVQRAIVQAPSKCCFVALSYVWGQVTQPTLNFLEPWKDVPKTIQQAIDLVLDLGYRFLWVDRYCIDQTDSHQKHQQISQMGAIYAAAHFTIVAAAGNGPDHGLPGTPSHIRRFLRHESIGSICLSILPSTKEMLPIIGSTWAS